MRNKCGNKIKNFALINEKLYVAISVTGNKETVAIV
jgi:hypothetical protein